jgi:hypothetical protein
MCSFWMNFVSERRYYNVSSNTEGTLKFRETEFGKMYIREYAWMTVLQSKTDC